MTQMRETQNPAATGKKSSKRKRLLLLLCLFIIIAKAVSIGFGTASFRRNRVRRGEGIDSNYVSGIAA